MPKHILSTEDLDDFISEKDIASSTENTGKRLTIHSHLIDNEIRSKFIVRKNTNGTAKSHNPKGDIVAETRVLSLAITAYNNI